MSRISAHGGMTARRGAIERAAIARTVLDLTRSRPMTLLAALQSIGLTSQARKVTKKDIQDMGYWLDESDGVAIFRRNGREADIKVSEDSQIVNTVEDPEEAERRKQLIAAEAAVGPRQARLLVLVQELQQAMEAVQQAELSLAEAVSHRDYLVSLNEA